MTVIKALEIIYAYWICATCFISIFSTNFESFLYNYYVSYRWSMKRLSKYYVKNPYVGIFCKSELSPVVNCALWHNSIKHMKNSINSLFKIKNRFLRHKLKCKAFPVSKLSLKRIKILGCEKWKLLANETLKRTWRKMRSNWVLRTSKINVDYFKMSFNFVNIFD